MIILVYIEYIDCVPSAIELGWKCQLQASLRIGNEIRVENFNK